MTKKELKEIIKECILESSLEKCNEGVIVNAQDSADNIIEKFKYFYKSPNTLSLMEDYIKKNSKAIFNRKTFKLNTNTILSMSDLKTVADFLNKEFFDKLVVGGLWRWFDPEFKKNFGNEDYMDKFYKGGETPVPIKMTMLPHPHRAQYSLKNLIDTHHLGSIQISVNEYFAKFNEEQSNEMEISCYNIIDPKDINYNDLRDSIEHELIHFQQHLRTNKAAGILFKQYKKLDPKTGKEVHVNKEISVMKITQPTKLKDETSEFYNDQIDYFNTRYELMPHARNVSSKYIEYILKTKYPTTALSGEQVKQIMLKEPVNTKLVLELFPQYRFLTPSNRKKYLKYLYQYIQQIKYKSYNPQTN